MKKKLLLVVLALAILTSLTAGTLAVYTRTVTETEQVQAKKFAFSAAGSIAGNRNAIKLAPTESMDYNFSIANFDEEGGAIAEVPLQYDVTIDFAAAAGSMPGLEATLYNGTTEIASSVNGVITYTTTSVADVSFDQDYTVTLTWIDDEASDEGHTTAGKNKVTFAQGFTMTVVATQVTE